MNDAYALGSSTRYNQALNSLVKHVQNDHEPLLGVNQINLLLKGTGISLNRFTGFAQAESRLANAKNRDVDYPTVALGEFWLIFHDQHFKDFLDH